MTFGLPQIVYNPGSGAVTINFVDGAQDFDCYYSPRLNRNISTSGQAETVFEHDDIFIEYMMPAVNLGSGAFVAWEVFYSWAIQGGLFTFSPNLALSDAYNCTLEMGALKHTRVAPQIYKSKWMLRINPDSSAPATPGQVLRRFYGYNT
jgi:hypothetical protein